MTRKRPPELRAWGDEIVVDSFAGGGGASLGIELALGRGPDVAINHDPEAIALHQANHPHTKHYCESVWNVDPKIATGGRPVGLMWLSPDCKHHSKAKGGKPLNKKVRGLAWLAVRWAKAVRPRVIVLENVEEFQQWGPLHPSDHPDAKLRDRPVVDKKGLTFRRFVGRLRALGYEVEYRELRACDYGAPTIRKRLFLIARCDGQAIVWPEPTHGPGRPQPWRTAAEIIDWSLPCPSIFLSREEGKAIGAKRPLADATMRRIAAGVKRYVLDAKRPFIVSLTHHGGDRLTDIDGPVPTITAAHRGELALTVPVIAGVGGRAGQSPPRSADQPFQTITTKADSVLVVPTLIQTGYGEDKKRNGGRGQDPRVPGLEKPLGTVVAGGGKHALVAAFMAQHNTDVVGHAMTEPVSTIVGKGCTQALVASSIVKLKGTAKDGQPLTTPLHTVQAGGTHYAEVRAFLVAYYSGGGQSARLDAPAPTVVSRERLGLVTVHGAEYAIVDIGMRMLAPRELYRAQGFPDSYRIDVTFTSYYTKRGKLRKRPKIGPLSKGAQVKMCGNSVCPPLARAIVAANYAPARLGERVA